MLFLEKIADIFEAIAHIIPPYQQIYEICKSNISDSQVKAEDYHLAALMSSVYVDLVQLSLQLYWIFCRGIQGTFADLLDVKGLPVVHFTRGVST
jgi:hypothetical protein